MRVLNLQNSIFGIGCALILFAIWFSINITFPPFRLTEGEQWAFGARAVAHLIGFAGMVMAGWFFIHSFSYMTSKTLHCLMGILFLGSMVLIWLATGTWRPVNPDIALLLCLMQLYALCGCAMAAVLRQHWPRLFEPAPALVIAVVGSILMSLLWEGVTQNLSNVYDGPARGFIQGAQISCDLFGITIGAMAVAYIQRQHRKNLRIS